MVGFMAYGLAAAAVLFGVSAMLSSAGNRDSKN
jgi:hypothetical protein